MNIARLSLYALQWAGGELKNAKCSKFQQQTCDNSAKFCVRRILTSLTLTIDILVVAAWCQTTRLDVTWWLYVSEGIRVTERDMQYNVQQQQQTHVVTSQPMNSDYTSPSSTVLVPRMWSYRLCSCCQDLRECKSTSHSCSARAKRTLFSAKSARTLAHFIMWTHFTFFLGFSFP